MQRVTDGRATTLGAATLLLAVLALAFPAFASAAPGCPSSVTMDDVHSGTSQFTALTCDDPSGTGLTYSVDPGNDAQLGFVSLDGSGGVSYFSNADAKGHDDWTVVVADNEGGSTNVAFSVDVVNAPPVCQNTSIEVTHGQQGFAFPDCSDPDGDGFTLHANPASHGTSGAAFGGLTYQSDASYAGPDSFTFYASDSVENGDPATASVTVTNSTPACTTDGNQQTLRTGKPITLHVNCFDIDGDPVTVGHTTPAHGTLGAFSDSGFGDYTATYTPSGTYTGPDTFSFSAGDGVSTSASFDFALTITANHAPQCDDNGAVHTRVDTAASVFFFCSDQDAQDQALDLHPGRRLRARARHARARLGLPGHLHARLGLHRPGRLQHPRLRRHAVGHLRPGDARREHAAVHHAAGRAGPLGQERRRDRRLHVPGRRDRSAAVRDRHAADQGHAEPVRHHLQQLPDLHRRRGRRGSGPVHDPPHRLDRLEPVRHPADHDRRRDQPRAGVRRRQLRLPPDRLLGPPGGAVPVLLRRGRRPAHLRGRRRPGPRHELGEQRRAQLHGRHRLCRLRRRALHGLGRPRRLRQRQLAGGRPRPAAAPCNQGPITATVRPGKTVQLQLSCFNPQDDPQTYSHTAAPRARWATSTRSAASTTPRTRARPGPTRSR